MVKRIPVEHPGDATILGQELIFPTSKRKIKNRFLKSALSEYIAPWNPANPEITGMASDVHVNMYEKWSAGGFGVVITGNVVVDQNHAESPGNTIISKELDSPVRREIWSKIASHSKKHGALIIAQLSNAGRQTSMAVNPHPFSSSDISLKYDSAGREYGNPIVLTTEQVQTEVIDKFVYTAKFLYECGFDGIQIHGAHGYLIGQFLSRTTNKRTDKYGGSPQNRARIVLDIYNAIRNEIPASTGFVIGIKLNSVEFQREGLTNDEAIQIAEVIDKAGLDFIELSGGTYEKNAFKKRESTIKREAFFLDFAQKIKPAVKNAILYVTGGFRTVPAMVQAIQNNETDGIGLGRPSTQEFDLPAKIIDGSVQSAAYWPFGDDFLSALLACSCQMAQAGLTPYTSKSEINNGIMDLTNEKIISEYKKAQNDFLQNMIGNMMKGKFYFGIVPYHLLNNQKFINEFEVSPISCSRKLFFLSFIFYLKIQKVFKFNNPAL